MANFSNIRKSLNIPDQEQIDALSEPSIMDQYIKEHDPEQNNSIEQAKALKWAQEAGPNFVSGMSIKAAIPEEVQLTKWLKLRQETDPNFGKMDQVIKDMPAQDPNFQRLSPEQVEKFKGYANAPLDYQSLINKMFKNK